MSGGFEVQVLVELAGCPTTCSHCWALGGIYGSMPLGDASFVLEELDRACEGRGVALTVFPMHEVTAHPQAADVIRLFAHHAGGLDPLLSPGSPLGSRADWAEILNAAAECGTSAFWAAFHGFGEEHDRQLVRPGAFEETCLALRRAKAYGLGTGANVFVTKPALTEFRQLITTLDELALGNVSIGDAAFTATTRGRHYERIRTDLDALAPVVDLVLSVDANLSRALWEDLGSYTEGAWVARSRTGTAIGEPDEAPRTYLVCRPNLDLHTGQTGLYRDRHGNLRRDGAQEVLERALESPPRTREQLYFPSTRISTVELASRYGDPHGTKVYSSISSLRHRWLDQHAHAHL